MIDQFMVPPGLAMSCSERPQGMAWLECLPAFVDELQRRWSLKLGAPFAQAGVCAWVAPAELPDGSAAVLKLGIPHMEAEHEIAGLRFLNGNPTVHLIDADDSINGMLLERCMPGTALRVRPGPEQDIEIAQLLRRLWRRPVGPHPFRPLSVMTQHWIEASLNDMKRWPDPDLTREGLRLLAELACATPADVLLATDLHAGNVLAAEREPWLAIDPKPFIGDPAYDATQHLLDCEQRMTADPLGLIERFSSLLGVDHERVRLWTFARLVAEPRNEWAAPSETVRALAP